MADESQQPDAADDAVTLEPAPAPSSRRRALALWGVLAVVAVGVGAVAVMAGGDDDGNDPLPIALGDGGGARQESAAMSADMAYGGIRYVAGDDLPDLGGTAPAYKLSGSVSEDQVRELADVFGLDGDLRHADGSWTLETDDGSLYVYEAGGGSWSYSSASPVAIGGGGSSGSAGACPADLPPEEAERCAAADGANASSTESDAVATTHAADTPVSDVDCKPDTPCTEPGFVPDPITPAADLPTEDEARQIALDLFADVGLTVDDTTVTVDGPYDAWYVNVEPTIDGVPVSGMAWSAGVGPHGEVQFASGYLSEPEKVGDYELITTRAAIDRLNEQMFAPFAAETEVLEDTGEIGIAEEEPTSSAPVPDKVTTTTGVAVGGTTGGTDGCGTTGGDDPVSTTLAPATDLPAIAVDPCYPTEPYIPPEPFEVVLHAATQSLLLVPSFDGSNDMYLVPAYRFPYDMGDGGTATWIDGVALADDALEPVSDPCARPVQATLPCPPGVVRPQVDEPVAEE